MYTTGISTLFDCSYMKFFRVLCSTCDKRIKQVAWEQPKIFKCSSHKMYRKIWYVECTLLYNLTFATPAAIIMAIKEFLNFCWHKTSTYQWLFWQVYGTEILAEMIFIVGDFYTITISIGLNFWKVVVIKRDMLLTFKKINFLSPHVNGTRTNVGNSRDYISATELFDRKSSVFSVK